MIARSFAQSFAARLDSFDFQETILSHWSAPVIAILTYLVAINGLEIYRKAHPASPQFLLAIRKVQSIHNLALATVSLAIVVGAFIILAGTRHGYFKSHDPYNNWGICNASPEPWTGPIGWITNIFYLTKYWELADTILQMAKGRRPPSYHFHVWHHTVYLMICYWYMSRRVSLGPMACICNGGVHVMMYYYYHLSAEGKVVPWKHMITKVQIVQFIISFMFYANTMRMTFITGDGCAGSGILLFHLGFNFTMIHGFFKILNRITASQKPKVIVNKRDVPQPVVDGSLGSQLVTCSSENQDEPLAEISERNQSDVESDMPKGGSGSFDKGL